MNEEFVAVVEVAQSLHVDSGDSLLTKFIFGLLVRYLNSLGMSQVGLFVDLATAHTVCRLGI